MAPPAQLDVVRSGATLAADGLDPTRPTPRRAMVQEYGASGSKLFYGFLSEEYNPDLQGLRKRCQAFNQLRRSDGQVAAILSVNELPIRAARWFVEPAGDTDQAGVEIADFVSHTLFDFGEQPWDDFLRQALSMLTFGFSAFEKVWAYMGAPYAGKLGLRKLAYRKQETVWRWLTDDHGGLLGIVQYAPPRYEMVTIPADKLLLFTHNGEGDNYEGISLLRPAWKHWLYKDRLYALQAIALERNGIAVPYAHWPNGFADAEAIDKAQQIVEGLRVDSAVSITGPDDIKFEFLSPGTTQQIANAFQTAIDHHDLLIARSVLAQFLNLGSGNVGSFALSQDQSELLLTAIECIADYVASVVNLHLIPQLVDLNYGEQDAYPQLAHSRIGRLGISGLGRTLNEMAQAGFLHPDGPMEDALREFLGLPERQNVGAWEQLGSPPPLGSTAPVADTTTTVPLPPGQPTQAQPNGRGPNGAGDGTDAETAGTAPDQPLKQGGPHKLGEPTGAAGAYDAEQMTAAFQRTAWQMRQATLREGQGGQQTGEKPSAYRARTRPRQWPAAGRVLAELAPPIPLAVAATNGRHHAHE